MPVESESDGDVRMDMRAVLAAIGHRWLRIVLVTILLLVATYAVLLFVPKLYESSASILVESRDNIYTRATNETQAPTPVADAGTISSQMELVQSRDTLLPVIHSQNLASVPEFNGSAQTPFSNLFRFFGKKPLASIDDIVLENLNDRLTVIRERDSAIINILVRSTDPKLAATLANAIANADVARRAELSLSDTADASQWLKSQIDSLRARVTDAENKVASFKVDNDLFTGINQTSLLDQQLSDVSAQITAAQQRKNTAQSRADLIRGLLKAGQPLDGVTDIRDSVTIQQLVQQKATLQSQRAQLMATLLPNHPSVKAVVAQIADIDKQIALEGRRIADGLDSEARVEAALADSLSAELTRLKGSSATATKQTVTLDELTREAKAQRDLLESYLSRYRDATARTDANSTPPDVRVVTLAAPTNTPVSPKTGFILGAVGFVAVALQIGSILFGELMSGRALIDRREPPVLETETVAIDEPEAEFVEPAPSVEPRAIETTAGEPPEEAAESPRRVRRGLRSWFAKRARPASPLANYEPPAVFPPSESEDARNAPSSLEQDSWSTGERIDTNASPAFRITDPLDLGNLSADLALGRAHVVILAALSSDFDAAAVLDRLVGDALHRGLSVVRVDAGSGRISTVPGLTDLSADKASFGDVVHKVSSDGLAEVPWGQLPSLDRQSTRPMTLIEALSDIYEVVIVSTGRIGMVSSLPMFAGAKCRLVLVSNGEPDAGLADNARADVEALGFEAVQIIAAPELQAAVA